MSSEHYRANITLLINNNTSTKYNQIYTGYLSHIHKKGMQFLKRNLPYLNYY